MSTNRIGTPIELMADPQRSETKSPSGVLTKWRRKVQVLFDPNPGRLLPHPPYHFSELGGPEQLLNCLLGGLGLLGLLGQHLLHNLLLLDQEGAHNAVTNRRTQW